MWTLLSVALATTLPGLPSVPLTDGPEGTLVLAAELPEALAAAGVEPGWTLVAVDDVLLADGREAVLRNVASGPARDLRLRFLLPNKTETLIVGRRGPLVQVDRAVDVPWPEGFAAPAKAIAEGPRGEVSVADAKGAAWVIDADGLVQNGEAGDALAMSPLFWEMSGAAWSIDDGTFDWGVRSWAEKELEGAVNIGPFGDDGGDHLVRITEAGLQVLSVAWPRGTPALPTCSPRVPETCLASGRQILRDMPSRAGAQQEALRHLELACKGGVYRGCFEAEAVERPDIASRASDCVDGSVASSCLAVAKETEQLEDDEPSKRLLGMYDFTCELEGAGTLGQRLRRLEEVGEGCSSLSLAFDRAGLKDQALLAMDRACVLGRAEACESATQRREDAFAARIVRECESEELPIAPSCVELGQVLQKKPVSSATLDDFGAFLRGCSLGSAQGCIALGDYVDRWGIDNERVLSAEGQLQKSCNDGELRACMGAAYLLERHEPRSEAYGQALVLFDRACDGRIAEACVAGAAQRRIGMAKKVEASEQLELWGQACALNEADGCAGLAERQGKSTEGLAVAFTSYNRSCDLGKAHSCSELGPFVEQKHEPWPGEQAPEVYLERGCDNGDPEGCYWLAQRTLPKNGEPPESTYLLLEKACQGDNGDACAALGKVHLDRKKSFDDEIAARHLESACDNGTYDACKTLGKMYVSGKGVDRDRDRARELRQRFQLNADRNYVRIGLTMGIPIGLGGELELVLPIPKGPALSIAGQASYIPSGGSVLVLLDGDDTSKPLGGEKFEYDRPDLTVLGGMARLYPNNKARGLFVGAGLHQLSADGGFPPAPRERFGWNAVVGLRTDSNIGYVGMETGIGQYGIIRTSDFDDDATEQSTPIPLIVPSLSFSFGFAPF